MGGNGRRSGDRAPTERVMLTRIIKEPRLRDLFRLAVKQGWHWRVTASSAHVILFSPDGERVCGFDVDPGNRRNILNALADARRAGLK